MYLLTKIVTRFIEIAISSGFPTPSYLAELRCGERFGR